MEVLILGWYILVESESVVLLVFFGALQYLGSLVSPMFGVAGDRFGYGRLLWMTRALYAVMAALLGCLAASDLLSPTAVLIIAGLNGLVRPSDMVMRYALIAQYLPAYLVVTTLYVVSFMLSLQVVSPRKIESDTTPIAQTDVDAAAPASRSNRPSSSPWQDLRSAAVYVWHRPALMGGMSMAFLANLVAFPLFIGLLPYVAKNIYGVGQGGLGWLGASFASGALLGCLLYTS
ncbi:MAG: arabinose ABC transporter permease, partial [Betaproteobacteria bacterium]|nr:arabinose ABC transporter permease [Betaproteobacteria bacterium]